MYLRNHIRCAWLFARIVWRVWDEAPGPGAKPFRLGVRLAWSVSRCVWIED